MATKRIHFYRVCTGLLLLLAAHAHAAAPLSFADDIQPILERNCLPCHNATKAEGGLQLETPQLMEHGGDSGPALKPNRALDSDIFLTASHQKKPHMPPDGNKSKAQPLSSNQLEILRRWIDEGALGNPKPKQAVAWKNMPASVQRVSAVAVSPDGQFAACGRGREATVYYLPLQRPVAALQAHPDIVSALAFSPDGNVLATGSHGEVKLWKKVPSLPPSLPIVPAAPDRAALAADIPELAKASVVIAFQSGADALVVWGSDDGKVAIWNRASKKIVRTIAAEGPVKLLASSLDGKILVVAAEGRPVRLVNVADGKTIAELKSDRAAWDRSASADLAVSGAAFELAFLQGELKLTQDRLTKLTEDSKKAEKDAVELGAKRAALEKARADAQVKRDALSKPRDDAEDALMAATTAQETAKQTEKDALSAAQAADAALAKADDAKKDAATKAAGAARAAATKATDARTAADKATTAAAEKQKKAKTEHEEAVKAFTEATGEVLRVNVAETNAKNLVDALSVLRVDEKTLLGSVDNARKINDAALKAQTDARAPSAQNAVPPVTSLAFSRESAMLVTLHDDGRIRAWQAETGQPLDSGNIDAKWELLRTIGDAGKVDSPLSYRVNALAFSPDGKTLATGSGEPSRSGEIKLWDPATGKLIREIPKPHKDCVLTLDFSSDGKLLASGAADKAVRIWDVATGAMSRNLEAHSSHVLSVAFRHDMRRLVSASSDNSMKTWDLRTSDVLKTFADFTKEVNSIRYLGEGDQVLAASGAPLVRIVKDQGGDIRSKTDGFPKFITAAAANRDGQIQAVGDVAGTLRVLGPDGKIIAQWPLITDTLAQH